MSKLIITEKEKMALNIAAAIGSYSQRWIDLGNKKRRRRRRGIKAYVVQDYTILPLSGHITNYATSKELERWTHDSVDRILKEPRSVVKVVSSSGYSSVIRNLAERSDEVIIATDSDEEGENIGLEVIELLRNSKPVRRLWLTTTIPSDIRSAFTSLRAFNSNLALSVEARRKIDALVGFAGTREVTLSLRRVSGGRKVLSFGRVQTSTLWLAIKREREIQSFIPRPYWNITAQVANTTFLHCDCPIFDRKQASDIFSHVEDEKEILCMDVEESTAFVDPPKPLNTAELLRVGSNILHISPTKVLSLAETLYLEGKITYPRVDNQTYSSLFDHRANLTKLENTKFGEYAKSLVDRKLTNPTRGRFAEDHEPITPIGAITEFRDPLAYRLYELTLRHYFSIFGPRAKFMETTVRGIIKNEEFKASGRRIVDAGFHEIYYYPAKKERPIDAFFKCTKYGVKAVEIQEKKTEPPPRFTHSTLLAEMEKQGIGTKSTRPLMIDTLKLRGYIRIVSRGTVYPTEHGMKFIESIEKPWGSYISPQFTARVESEMEKISEGKSRWEELVDKERWTFNQAVQAFRKHAKG